MAELKNKAVNLEVLKEAYKDLDTKKANKTDISVPYKFRGNCTFASLPTSGNEINDTFYVTDEKCKYSWNGTNWYQSSLDETDYLDEFNTFKGEVNNVKGDLYNISKIIAKDFKWITGKFVYTVTGALGLEPNCSCTDYIRLPKSIVDRKIRFKSKVPSNTICRIAFYNCEMGFISCNNESNIETETVMDIPDGAEYVRMSCSTNFINNCYFSLMVSSMYYDENTQTYLSDFKRHMFKSEIMWGDGKILSISSGNVLDDSTYSTSDFIELPELYYDKVTYISPIGNSTAVASIGFFDSNKKYISGIYANKKTTETIATIPSNSKYVRMCVLTDSKELSYFIIYGNMIDYMINEERKTREHSISAVNRSKLKIAMFGDSITWGSVNGIYTEYNIPYWVSKQLGCEVSNFGVGSQGWIKAVDDKTGVDKIKETDLTGYDVATIMYGINDSNEYLGTYQDTVLNETIMGSMYEAVRYIMTTYPEIILIIISPPNTCNKGTSPRWRLDAKMLRGYTGQDMVDEYKKFCDYYQIGYISHKDSPINSFNIEGMLSDTLHRNIKGYELEGKYLAAQIARFI